MDKKLQELIAEDRRIFIKGLGAVGVGLVGATLLGGCEWISERIRNRPIRRRLRLGSAELNNQLEIYRQAVALMKSLPVSDPRSWLAQANMHGTPAGFNLCEHGTQHFFSWHRAYLFYFEQICKELTGENDFALPYWNWNQDGQVHPAFLDSNSPLYHPRNNTSVTGLPSFSNATLNPIFRDANFITFSRQLEGTPHNSAHTAVGGDMGTAISARDPLFWMHHCMVDYCWAKWNLELENDNPNNDTWLNREWNHFIDRNGNSVSITAGLTLLLPLLSYRYECSPIGENGCPLNLAALSTQEFRRLEAHVKLGADVSFDVKQRFHISQGQRLLVSRPVELRSNVTGRAFDAVLEPKAESERVFLNIAYARLPQENHFYVRVFLNSPYATAKTALDDIHYAGSFAFFGTDTGNHHQQHHKHEGPKFLINVTDTLARLRKSGRLKADEPITIQLIAVPLGEKEVRPDLELELEDLSFLISPVHIKQRQNTHDVKR